MIDDLDVDEFEPAEGEEERLGAMKAKPKSDRLDALYASVGEADEAKIASALEALSPKDHENFIENALMMKTGMLDASKAALGNVLADRTKTQLKACRTLDSVDGLLKQMSSDFLTEEHKQAVELLRQQYQDPAFRETSAQLEKLEVNLHDYINSKKPTEYKVEKIANPLLTTVQQLRDNLFQDPNQQTVAQVQGDLTEKVAEALDKNGKKEKAAHSLRFWRDKDQSREGKLGKVLGDAKYALGKLPTSAGAGGGGKPPDTEPPSPRQRPDSKG